MLACLHVTRHTSHVTRHTSHVTRHTSHVTRHTSLRLCYEIWLLHLKLKRKRMMNMIGQRVVRSDV